MSTCISMHGEYSAHTPDEDYVCTRCEWLDEDTLIEQARGLRAAVDAVQNLHVKVSGGGWAICHACADPWPCKTADILAATTREQTR